MRRWVAWWCMAILFSSAFGSAGAQVPQDRQTRLLNGVTFDQRLDNSVPLDLSFRDSTGRSRPLSDFFASGRPVVLVLGYFRCSTLCGLVRDGLVRSLAQIDFTVGRDFDVVYVSIDPQETPEVAAAFRKTTAQAYGRDGTAGWWFLTSPTEEPIQKLADAIGFRYVYDPLTDQYAHPAGIVVLTPSGRISRYLFGVTFEAKDLRFALMDAAQQRIGALTDLVLLRCYHYDPQTGRYTVAVWRIMRFAGLLTVAGLGGLLWFLFRRERHGASPS